MYRFQPLRNWLFKKDKIGSNKNSSLKYREEFYLY